MGKTTQLLRYCEVEKKGMGGAVSIYVNYEGDPQCVHCHGHFEYIHVLPYKPQAPKKRDLGTRVLLGFDSPEDECCCDTKHEYADSGSCIRHVYIGVRMVFCNMAIAIRVYVPVDIRRRGL